MLNSIQNTISKIQQYINIDKFESFSEWLVKKFEIHIKIKRPSFKEQEIWWCSFGYNIGDEENGKGENFMRPVVIIRKYNKNLALVVPTSTKLKNNQYYHPIEYENKKYSVLISQLKTIDSKRLRKKIVTLGHFDFQNLTEAMIQTTFNKKIDPAKQGVVASANL